MWLTQLAAAVTGEVAPQNEEGELSASGEVVVGKRDEEGRTKPCCTLRERGATGRGSAMSSRMGCCVEKARLRMGEMGDCIGEWIGEATHEEWRFAGGDAQVFADEKGDGLPIIGGDAAT